MIRMNVDIHTYILPGMDEGSRSLDMSIEMLRREATQGISHVGLTPHYCPEKEEPEAFLRRRQQAFQQLCRAMAPGLPVIHLGAEVEYFPGICDMEGLNRFCMDGRRLLFLEMPLRPWTSRDVSDVLTLNQRPELWVVLSHIDQYMKFAEPFMLDRLHSHGVLLQSDVEFFLNRKTRRKALAMYQLGQIDLLGSGCRNLSSCPPNLPAVYPILSRCSSRQH